MRATETFLRQLSHQPIPIQNHSHVDPVVILDLGSEGLGLRRAEHLYPAEHFALLVHAHENLQGQRVMNA